MTDPAFEPAFDPASHLVALVDDDPDVRNATAQTLRLAGFHPLVFERAEDALAVVSTTFAGVVISDVRMPRIGGLELHRRIAAIDPELPVILFTGHGDIEDAVQAMKAGAFDFIAKPFAPDRLTINARRALAYRHLVLENRRLKAAVAAPEPDVPLVGEAPAIVALRAAVRELAGTDANVLIEGEAGVGKEYVALVLHQLSLRRRNFSIVECGFCLDAQIADDLFGEPPRSPGLKPRKGRVEAAEGGTLFLHDVDKASPTLQTALARLIEERAMPLPDGSDVRPVSFRVISASSVDLEAQMRAGAFRADLYFGLSTVRLHVPPLRARRGDIPLLFSTFQAEAARRLQRPAPPMTDTVRRHLVDYDWPSNMRELQHFAEQVVLGIEDRGAALDDERALDLGERVHRFEADVIRDALVTAKGDVRTALSLLRIPRKTFYDKLARHRIDIDAYRPNRRDG
jgi:two-component system C4-dicarboxylate transport response regulator DctD